MSNSGKKFDEESLRKKIREQLEKEHQHAESIQPKKEEPAVEQGISLNQQDESYYLEIYIRRKLQEEVYSKYPEFVQCGNHLDQIKWLTPLEMEEEFEFFPIEYTFWARFRRKSRPEGKIKIPDTPEIKAMIEEFRRDIEADAQERIERYNAYLKENQKHIHNEMERKIFEEEQDRFYASKKGYHKYKNHINETRWMTHAQFDAQEEFTDRVYTPKELFIRKALIAVLVFTTIIGGYSIMEYLKPPSQKGYVVVQVSEEKSSLYIDQNLSVGFKPGVAYPMDAGEHILSISAAGFKAEPKQQLVEVEVGDTSYITFNMAPYSGEMGVIRIAANNENAGVFVDGVFEGTVAKRSEFKLPVGDHSLSVKLPNFHSNPPLKSFAVAEGDTLDFSFTLTPQKRKTTTASIKEVINLGLIEVTSNVHGAKIYLDGQLTGFTTDYALQKIPMGQHIIRLEKEGYKVYPKEQVVRISKNSRQAKVNFTLTSTNKPIKVNVKPATTEIFIDGKSVGKGSFYGSIDLGNHTITFSDVEGYYNPGKKNINVTDTRNLEFNYEFGSKLFYQATPKNVLPSNKTVSILPGYIMTGVNFKQDNTNGPEQIKSALNAKSAWKMGFAFSYRNPPGNDAIVMRFIAPDDLNILNDVKLKLWLYELKENYPLVVGGKARFKVILNNSIIVDNKAPKHSYKTFSPGNFEAISIGARLKPGFNTLIISVADENTRFMELQKIVIE